MIPFKFNKEKSISALLYVIRRLLDDSDNRAKTNFHKIFKILYFADLKHLSTYGRPIIGDTYIAMKNGPVPSRIYDMVKTVGGQDTFYFSPYEFDEIFEVRGYYVFPKQEPDMDEFSESDVECLDNSFEENKYLSFGELQDKSHDEAYNKALQNSPIANGNIAKVGGADEAMLSYIKNLSENTVTFSL